MALERLRASEATSAPSQLDRPELRKEVGGGTAVGVGLGFGGWGLGFLVRGVRTEG